MPTQTPDFISAPAETAIEIGLEPAHNGLYSLILLSRVDELSGLDDWVTRTASALTPEQQHTHRLVFLGLYYSLMPTRRFPSFTAYVDDLAAQPPVALRDRVLGAYARVPILSEKARSWTPLDESIPMPDPTPLLASREAFIAYLRERFAPEHIDVAIESEAHALLNDPPAMQQLIVSHLRRMWADTLAAEWQRLTPMLQACVDAFKQIELDGRTILDTARLVLGREPNEYCKSALEQAEQVIFVPSGHLGPYHGHFKTGRVYWQLFGARLPAGAQTTSPELSRSELLSRLTAVADDTRLRILQLLAEQGEMCSPDIMRRLDLSQSAASRHLQLLSATGYLVERWREGAKCYSLNPERIDDTMRSLARFMDNKRS
jgi:ArsR family transcriptional regulator